MAADLYRYRVILSGWQGGPGLNTFFLRFGPGDVISSGDVQQGATDIMAVYTALKSFGLDGLSARVDGVVDVISDTDGILKRQWNITAPAPVNALSSGTRLPRMTMVKCKYTTDKVIVNDKGSGLLRGGIYYGPLAESGVNTGGQIDSNLITAVGSAFGGLLNELPLQPRLVVWHRPSGRGATDGDSGFVQSVTAKPVPAVLRSRRD
jgi:hypothetical protein